MGVHKYKFSYTPQYSDLLYLGVFLIGGGTIALLKYPFFIPLVWGFVITGIYLFIRQKPQILFYEDFIEVAKGLGKSKNITVMNYSDVQYVQYCFAEIRGSNLFKITFLKEGNSHTIQYSFSGRPSQNEINFFNRKGITIKVIPESARYKLYP
ncbi:MAG TPA: hypothetical protein VFN30_04310 [Chitinophagaceae bacterium]|nr:hypothetical protein [Chitinophagaceae bacterium]